MTMTRTLGELAGLLEGELHGDPRVEIDGIHDLRLAGPRQLGFVRTARYASLARSSAAAAVLVPERLDLDKPQIVVPHPDAAFARVAAVFHPERRAAETRIHPSAAIAPDAVLADPVEIGPHVTVGPGARIGAGTRLEAGVVVGRDAVVGRDTVLHPRVVLYDRVRVGDRCIVHAGAVLGADGFGYARDAAGWVKIPQIGSVVVGDDVEIGANVTIDRGALGDTRIGNGTKIDDLVHIGHNCEIGARCAIAGFTALSGSTRLGDDVVLAGHVVSAGHLTVPSGARIGGNSVLRGDVPGPGDWMGYPLVRRARWGRALVGMRRLAEGTGPTPSLDGVEAASRDGDG